MFFSWGEVQAIVVHCDSVYKAQKTLFSVGSVLTLLLHSDSWKAERETQGQSSGRSPGPAEEHERQQRT